MDFFQFELYDVNIIVEICKKKKKSSLDDAA